MSSSQSTEPSQHRIPSSHLQEAVELVAKKNGFKNPRYVVSKGCDAGDNYCSLLYRVSVMEGEDSSRKLSVMVKGQVASAALRSAMKLCRAFTNEATFYSEVLPAYAEALREVGLLEEGAHYPDAPRCFYASTGNGMDEKKDVLILQDLRPEGFVMLDRRRGVDLQHCRLVMNALAHLHASSLALEHLQPQRFNQMKAPIVEMLQPDADIMKMLEKDIFTTNALEMIRARFPEGSSVYEKTRDYCNTAYEDISHLTTPVEDGGNVLCHGDCWINNLLFAYSVTGEVERACFLDFQLSRYASPVLDLMYFMYACTEKALRDAHLDTLLREYHSRLQARMRALGVPDPDAVFSWQRMEAHLRKRGRIGMLMGVLAIPVFTAEKEDAPDLAARLENGGAAKEAFLVKCKDTTERDRRVSDVAEEMVKRGYI